MGDEVTNETCVPIACTLEAGDLPERLAEWRSFLQSSVTSTQRASSKVRLRLSASDATLVAAVSLSQREKECCAFFDFAIELHADARWLSIGVPKGAEEVLTTFMEMLDRP